MVCNLSEMKNKQKTIEAPKQTPEGLFDKFAIGKKFRAQLKLKTLWVSKGYF